MRYGLLGVGLLLLGCAGPSHPPVPRPLAEQVPPPPPATVVQIWQPGHFDWDGVTYVWSPGAWVDRAGRGSLWQDGYWRDMPTGQVWVPAHWL